MPRPRVAALDLSEDQLASITPFCATLRSSRSPFHYQMEYSWVETDIVVARHLNEDFMTYGPHVLTSGTLNFHGRYRQEGQTITSRPLVSVSSRNTERELKVSDSCPPYFTTLAKDLASQLSSSISPPSVVTLSDQFRQQRLPLLETTTGKPVALFFTLTLDHSTVRDPHSKRLLLVLPHVPDLSGWMRAFLTQVHSMDPSRVPHAPPRMSVPTDWYTPEQRSIEADIQNMEEDISALEDAKEEMMLQLIQEGEKADAGVRRAIWSDGDELVDAATQLLSDLGFEVQNMDATRLPNEPKREDLRLTQPGRPEWEAVVEVKGYTRGIATNDTRQINEHVKSYIAEKGHQPDLIVWITNAYRHEDPSLRRGPDSNVEERSQHIDAVHVSSSDLYRQWVRAQTGEVTRDRIVQQLSDAKPGLWSPSP